MALLTHMDFEKQNTKHTLLASLLVQVELSVGFSRRFQKSLLSIISIRVDFIFILLIFSPLRNIKEKRLRTPAVNLLID
jgi:hypothetical protein